MPTQAQAQAKTQAQTYPSVPIPQDNVDSLYQSFLLMRQTIQLLIVNTQQISNQVLTQAAQTFSTKTDVNNAVSSINNNLATVNNGLSGTSGSLSNANNNISTLQSQVSALQAQVTSLNGDINTLQTQIKTLTSSLAEYLQLGGGTMTGNLNFDAASGNNIIAGFNNSGSSWVVRIGDINDEFVIRRSDGTPLFWCKQDGSIHAASTLVIGAHP